MMLIYLPLQSGFNLSLEVKYHCSDEVISGVTLCIAVAMCGVGVGWFVMMVSHQLLLCISIFIFLLLL